MESDAWQYTWFVPQDVPGLIDAMGRDRFVKQLNDGFEKSAPRRFNGGGRSAVYHGNEPSMHMAWLFNWAGKPWLTQKWVRAILDRYYGYTPNDFYLGDEDQGQMSSWFVMAALGLFEMDGGCRVHPVYEISAPLYPEITVHLSPLSGGGKTFVIAAPRASTANCYIQSATLNGQPLNRWWISWRDVAKGGKLTLELGPDAERTMGAGLPVAGRRKFTMKIPPLHPLLFSLLGPACLPLAANAQTPAPHPPASSMPEQAARAPAPTPAAKDFHGYACRDFQVDGCGAKLVEPTAPLPGRPWVWRTLFWDAYPAADIELLKRGFHVAYIGVGNTFGSPDALKHFDAFYAAMTGEYGLSKRPALEGLSRGGLYAYRWASEHPEKVGCIYGDAPVCDLKSWPGGRGRGTGSKPDWALAIQAYHFTDEQQLLDYPGNPVDALAPLAAAGIPIIHVVGDADTTVPPAENSDLVRERYTKAGGVFVEVVKEGCGHHPHGLTDPTPVADFIVARCAGGDAAQTAAKTAPPPGARIVLSRGHW